jgi:WD40 repeat protein
VVGGGMQHLYVWNTSSEKLVATLTAPKSFLVSSCIFFHDTRIAAGGFDKMVTVWQAEKLQWKCLYVLEGHTRFVENIISADNARIISFSWDKTLRVWNSDSGKCIHILTGHKEIPDDNNSCVMSVDNQVVGSIDRQGEEIKLWNVTTGICTQTIPRIHADDALRYHIGYLSSERLVWWGSNYQSGKVEVWNLITNTDEYILHFDKGIKLVQVSTHDDYKFLIVVLNEAVHKDEDTKRSFIQVYYFETGKLFE